MAKSDLLEKEQEDQYNPAEQDYRHKTGGDAPDIESADPQEQKRYDKDWDDIVGGLKNEEEQGNDDPEKPGKESQKSANDKDSGGGLYNAAAGAGGGSTKRLKKIAGAAGGGLVAVILIIFLAFMFEAFKSKIFSHFLDRFYGAVTHKLLKHRGFVFFDRWLKLDIFPAAKACGNTIDLNCVNQHRGTEPSGMFGTFVRAYRNQKVAQLFQQEGISLRYEGGNYILTTKLGDSDPVPEAEAESGQFDQVFKSKYDVRSVVMQALEKHGTVDRKAKRMVMRVLRHQYGARLCLFYCRIAKTLETRNLSITEKFRRFKMALVGAVGKRIIDAGVARQVILLDCLTSQLDCTDDDAVRNRLREINTEDAFRLLNTPAAFDQLVKDGELYTERKLAMSQQLYSLMEMTFERLLSKVLEQQTARLVVRTIPYVGWAIAMIEFVAVIHDFLDLITNKSGANTLRNIWSEIKASQTTQSFALISAAGDEAEGVGKAVGGGFDLTAIAVVAEIFRGIEQSKFYQYQFGSLAKTPDYQPGRPDTGEKCRVPMDDEKTVPPKHEESFCGEMKLDREPIIVTMMNDEDLQTHAVGEWQATMFQWMTNYAWVSTWLVKQAVSFVIGPINNALEWVLKILLGPALGPLQQVLNALLKLLLLIPMVQEMLDKAKEIVMAIFHHFIPLIFRNEDEVKGSRFAAAAAVGADFSYNYEMTKGGVNTQTNQTYGMGGRLLTEAESAELYNEVVMDETDRFKNLSFKERFFSLDEPSSLLSRLIMVTPSDTLTDPQTMVANISNPLASLFGFVPGSLMYGTAYAVPVKRIGPSSTGTPQYGVPLNDPIMTSEPSQTNDTDCQDSRMPEGEDAMGRELYTKNPVQCMLDKETVRLWAAPYSEEPLGE